MSPISNFGTTLLEIASNIALGAGLVCILCLVYLFIRWVFGIRIMMHKTIEQKLTDIDYSLEALESRAFNLSNQLNTLKERIVLLRKGIQNNKETTKNE